MNTVSERPHQLPVSTDCLPLGEHVRTVLEQYFVQLDGHWQDLSTLHELVIGEVEKPLIMTVLEYTGHNQSKAAKVLGLSRSTLRKKMLHYGLDNPSMEN